MSRMPLVWFSAIRMVTGVPYSGSSGMYFRIGSSSESLPWTASWAMAAAVNCLATDPDSTTENSLSGVAISRLAMP